jgi:hypothetical protein
MSTWLRSAALNELVYSQPKTAIIETIRFIVFILCFLFESGSCYCSVNTSPLGCQEPGTLGAPFYAPRQDTPYKGRQTRSTGINSWGHFRPVGRFICARGSDAPH